MTLSANALRLIGAGFLIMGAALYFAVLFSFDAYWFAAVFAGLTDWFVVAGNVAIGSALIGLACIGASFIKRHNKG